MRKVAVALVVLLRERRLRSFRVEIGLGLADGRLLQGLFAFEAIEGRLARLDNRRRPVSSGAKIAVVEPDQRLPRAHIFVVANEDLRHEASNMRRYRRDIAAGIGVVGAFDEAPDAPIFIPIPRADERDYASKRRVGQPLEPRSCQEARRGCLGMFAGDGAHRDLLGVTSFCRTTRKSVYTPIWASGLKLSGIRSVIV